mgnify:CR=1 FL=1
MIRSGNKCDLTLGSKRLKTLLPCLWCCIAIALGWLWVYNIVVHDMGWIEGFFKILDGVNELVIGVITLSVIGLGIVAVFTLTNLFSDKLKIGALEVEANRLFSEVERGNVESVTEAEQEVFVAVLRSSHRDREQT